MYFVAERMYRMKIKTVLSITAWIAVLLLCVSCGQSTPTADGLKTVTVDVVTLKETVTFTLETEAQTLREALEENDLVEGTESEYGLFVTSVNGVVADEANQEWWCFTKSGESLMTGVDGIQIADGDHYEITLTSGY